MTQEQSTAINQQNAAHSTGPKTPEGKARSAQNAVTHGLSSSKPPLENPDFIQLHREFLKERNPQTPSQRLWVLELTHIAWKLKQIPSFEYEIELNSPLTPAEHFAQDKPAPLARLWNLQLRLLSRFNALDRKLQSAANASLAEHPSAPSPVILQNEPSRPGVSTGQRTPPANPTPPQPVRTPAPLLQNEPTPPQSPQTLLNEMHDILRQNSGMAQRLLQNPDIEDDSRAIILSFLQNEPTAALPKIPQPLHSVPISIPNPS